MRQCQRCGFEFPEGPRHWDSSWTNRCRNCTDEATVEARAAGVWNRYQETQTAEARLRDQRRRAVQRTLAWRTANPGRRTPSTSLSRAERQTHLVDAWFRTPTGRYRVCAACETDTPVSPTNFRAPTSRNCLPCETARRNRQARDAYARRQASREPVTAAP